MIELLRKRKSVRNYLDKKIEPETVNKLLEAALLSPSSRGINPWEFIVVQESSTIRKLSEAKEHGSSFISAAPLVIVVAADSRKTDVWTEDCSIASIIVQLEAEHLGLGSCWVQIRLRETKQKESSEAYVRKILSLPEYYAVESLISIGYPADERIQKEKKALQWEKCHRDSFSNRFRCPADQT